MPIRGLDHRSSQVLQLALTECRLQFHGRAPIPRSAGRTMPSVRPCTRGTRLETARGGDRSLWLRLLVDAPCEAERCRDPPVALDEAQTAAAGRTPPRSAAASPGLRALRLRFSGWCSRWCRRLCRCSGRCSHPWWVVTCLRLLGASFRTLWDGWRRATPSGNGASLATRNDNDQPFRTSDWFVPHRGRTSGNTVVASKG